MATQYEAIVVGAGVSGLSAANWLRNSGVKVLVLEARDRVGGRTYTKTDPAVGYVDLGGAYLGPTQDHLIRMAKELGVENYKVNEDEDIVYYDRGTRYRWRGGGLPKFWNPFVIMDVNNFLRSIDEMAEEVPDDAPWDAPHAEEWDTMTCKEFIDKTLYTKTGNGLASLFLRVGVTSEPYEASLLWFLWYVKLCGGSLRFISTTNGGQERKFIGGSQQISLKLADRLEGSVLLNKPVAGIQQKGNIVTVRTLDGVDYTAHHVILALPPPLQMRIHFDPELPALRNQLMQRMPLGSAIKCIIYYKKAFWKELGACGSMIIITDELEHPICFTFDDTKPDGSHPAIIGFLTADKCRRLVTKTKEERLEMIVKSFSVVLRSKEALQPIHYEEHPWIAEQYSGGCYTSMCPPGLLTRYGQVLRRPIGRLYFAGTETATKWSGYIDGAISAGERAAREVLYDMGKIGRDEIWRMEPKSKEIPGEDVKPTFMESHLPSVPAFLRFMKMALVCGVIATFSFNIGKCRTNLNIKFPSKFSINP